MAPRVVNTPRDPAHNHVRAKEATVDTIIIRTDPTEVLPEETAHGCYEGWVYLGFEGEDENGEPTEEIERVPCRRCNPKTL
jgi:hypothetical protein